MLAVDVWNRASDGLPLICPGAPICLRCFQAFREMDQTWTRSSEIASSFHSPLSKAILGVPLPNQTLRRSLVVYEQEFAGPSGDGKYSESVSFWYATSDSEFDATLSGYTERQHLHLERYSTPSMPGEVFVKIGYFRDRVAG
jgi:hypothetical protein